MTSDKDKKIEAAANNYCNTEGYDEYSGHEEFDAFTAGANFGYELAVEDLSLKMNMQDTPTESRLKLVLSSDNILRLKAKITELEQQLEKAEKVIEKYKEQVWITGTGISREESYAAKTYLTNKGGKGE